LCYPKGPEMRPSEQREPTVEEIIACVTSYYRGERRSRGICRLNHGIK
jgi:hypothetical protein